MYGFNGKNEVTYYLKPKEKKPKSSPNEKVQNSASPTNAGSLHYEYDTYDDLIRGTDRKRVTTKIDFASSLKEEPSGQAGHKFIKSPNFMMPNNHEIYDMDDLSHFLTKEANLTVTRDFNSKSLSVKLKVIKDSKDQYFEQLSRELKDLSKEFNKEMDEIHMLFMEVS